MRKLTSRDTGKRSLHAAFQHWAGRALREWQLLVGLFLLLGAVWGFVKIAEEVMEGETHAVDEWILLAMRNPSDRADPIGPRWVEEMGRDLTALGGVAILVIVVLATAGFLVMQRKRRAAVVVVVSTSSGILLSSLLKYGFDRPRPDLVPHGSNIYTTSFPSGHSLMSAVTYLTLGALLARTQPQRPVKVYVFTLALLLTMLVGISRVYLGVHWPTDVLAGWAAGAGWALLVWLITYFLQRKGQVEQDDANVG